MVKDGKGKRGSHIHPDGLDCAAEKFVRFHPLTNRFQNAPLLEEMYEQNFVEEHLGRTVNICGVFLLLYLLFTGANFANLFHEDESVREKSRDYCLLVYPVMFPVPFLIWLSTVKSYRRYYQIIYSIVVLCWSFSFIAGGIHSLLSEWFTYIETDVVNLLKFIGYSEVEHQTLELNRDITSCNCTWWDHESVTGNQQQIFFHYFSAILLPAATMNINLLRLIMVFVVVPLFKIDTPHYAFVVAIASISYCALTAVYFPTTDSAEFLMNKTLVFCFPIILSVVMLLRNRDFERIMRMGFLHVYAVEQEAKTANRQKELIADENEQLKKELEQQRSMNETTFDLDTPIAKILTDLKTIQADVGFETSTKLAEISITLSRLDHNLFTPDINAQMKDSSGVDSDTKNWAMSVLGNNNYTRNKRFTSATSPSSSRVGSMYDNSGKFVPALLPNIVSIEETLMAEVKDEINSKGWDVDSIGIAERTGNRPLYYVMTAVFEINGLFDQTGVDRSCFTNFAFLLDEGYIDNPYHNSCHAADVVNGVHHLMTGLSNGRIQHLLTLQEFFAAIVAAGIHDFRHPGKSNIFMVKSNHPLAIQFSDSSVLERMHLAESFLLLRDDCCNIFANLKDKHYREVRKAIIEMVLSTDLSVHLQLVGNLKTAMLSEQKEDVANDPMMLMKVVVKCADIGHSSKIQHLHGQWSSLIIEEFFLQGDEERRLGLQISPFMDRSAENSAKNQVGFFEFIALPFYETVAEVMFGEDFTPILNNIRTNYKLWKQAVQLQLTSISTIRKQVFDATPSEFK